MLGIECNDHNRHIRNKFVHFVVREPSQKTASKLNTDGFVSNKIAGIGAVIRDQQGKFIRSLAINIGTIHSSDSGNKCHQSHG